MNKKVITNDSTFSVNKIGLMLAELLSILENRNYSFKEAEYNAIVWDWNEQYPEHIDDLNESCYVLTTDTDDRPVFGENICLSNRFSKNREGSSVCIGMIDYDHKYRDYQNIVDDQITFYDYTNNEKDRLIRLPHEDIMYGYIDSLISYLKISEECDLDLITYKTILNDYVDKSGLRNVMKLQREKNV